MLSQSIPEEGIVVQNLRGDILHGNPEHLAMLSSFHHFLCDFQIEFISIGAGHGFKGLEVDGGIHRFDVEFFIDGLQINGIRFADGLHIFHSNLELMETIGIQDLFVDITGIKSHAGCTHDNHQGLRGGVFIELIRSKNRFCTFQTIGGLCKRTAGIFCIFLSAIIPN